ncbi:hypothetical protein TI39_contig440g00009 [Zymoseptoria brevis]|uniref:Uncharacterized protein n=1 Tax=Zymoseptoria brevis TaxID=1047168 RepID=A0A0F4GLX8_9PEZI|nr:hypothetical protein TI39_contig440g00009 [Zymoseptoria brevis]
MPDTNDTETTESNDPPTAAPASPSSNVSRGEMSDAQPARQKNAASEEGEDTVPQQNSSTHMPLPSTTPSTQVYSKEARVYHARHAALIEDHDNQRHHQCEQGCLALLLEPRVPHYTRIQVLQLLATVVAPSRAGGYLSEAQEMLDLMDGDQVGVQLLKDDNRRMLADLDRWRAENGLDVDLEGTMEDQSEEDSGEDREATAS